MQIHVSAITWKLLKQNEKAWPINDLNCFSNVKGITGGELPDVMGLQRHLLNTGTTCISPPQKVRGTFVQCRSRGVGVGVTVCIYHISWINWWKFFKLAWIYQWDKPKGWISFCDFDHIFKATGNLRLLNLLRRRRRDNFLYAKDLLNQ